MQADADLRVHLPWRDVEREEEGRRIKEANLEFLKGRMILMEATGVVVAMTHDQVLIPGDLQRSLNQAANLVGTPFGQVMPRRGDRLVDAAGVARERMGVR